MIAFFGMGLLGSNFVRALRRRGEDVHVWNRSHDKAAALEADGARAFRDPAEAARGAARIHLTLTDDAAVDAVLEQARPGMAPGTVIVDHSTTSTGGVLARIARWRDRGMTFVHAPVFMGPQNARDSTGFMLLSGPPGVIDPLRPVLAPMTGKLVDLGERPEAAS
jgi:3-hydroxyisobutyrate dehydrogenase